MWQQLRRVVGVKKVLSHITPTMSWQHVLYVMHLIQVSHQVPLFREVLSRVHLKLAFTQSYFYCTLYVSPPHAHTKKPVLAVGWWTLNNVSGRACGRKWISMGFRAISSFNKKWNSSKGARREKACDLQSDGVGVTSDQWVFSVFKVRDGHVLKSIKGLSEEQWISFPLTQSP